MNTVKKLLKSEIAKNPEIFLNKIQSKWSVQRYMRAFVQPKMEFLFLFFLLSIIKAISLLPCPPMFPDHHWVEQCFSLMSLPCFK